MAQSDRQGLVKQTLSTLKKNTTVPYRLYTENGMKDGEMVTVNRLVRQATEDFDWEWLVRTDDDMHFMKGWLKTMINAMEKNKDVWLLGGSQYPTHKTIEERENINITEIAAGCHWLLPRWVWDKYAPFYEDFIEGQAEDVRFCQALQEDGGKVACLKDKTLVVHCGIIGTSGKGRSEKVNKYFQYLADIVGAKTNWDEHYK